MPHADLFLASGGSVFEHVATNGMLFSCADRTSSRESGQPLKAGRTRSLRTRLDEWVRSNTLSWPARCQERNQRSRVPPERFSVDTTQAKPVGGVCFVCCLRASGAGGRLPGTWSIRPNTQPATGPRGCICRRSGSLCPLFFAHKTRELSYYNQSFHSWKCCLARPI
jgi:hypothetical protein